MRLAARTRQDLLITLAAGALLLAWDFSGWDLAVARLFADSRGFAAREAWWASRLLHDGGRIAAWLLLALLVAGTLRVPKAGPVRGPTRAERWWWIGVIGLCVLAVPAIKRFSTTSCPWDLAEFGGVARYVSHWTPGVLDGGGGHCFPSGHAVAAFGFFGLYFLWRRHDARAGRLWLAAVIGTGLLFGTAQLARGAHYPSHTLWSAWLCWTLCVLAAPLVARRTMRSEATGASP
jgi:membrane-associated PAP2 superfamily phosphatase